MPELKLEQERAVLSTRLMFKMAADTPREDIERLKEITSQWDDATIRVLEPDAHDPDICVTAVIPDEDTEGYKADLEEAGFIITTA